MPASTTNGVALPQTMVLPSAKLVPLPLVWAMTPALPAARLTMVLAVMRLS